MLIATGAERRKSPRTAAARPCKVFHTSTGRYLPGETRDVSAGGLCLTVRSPRPLLVGERIDISVAWEPAAVLRAAQTRTGVVRRSQTTAAGQVVGVELDEVCV